MSRRIKIIVIPKQLIEFYYFIEPQIEYFLFGSNLIFDSTILSAVEIACEINIIFGRPMLNINVAYRLDSVTV